jgi:hypothetical protein
VRGRRALAEALLHFYLSNVVALQTHAPWFVLEVSGRPRASPLARLQAAAGGPVACLRHCVVELSEFDRAVLRHLDGSRDQAALLETLAGAVADGTLEVRRDGQPLRDRGQVREVLGEALGPSLRRLADRCLLVA